MRGVGASDGFAFTRRRLGCHCVPAAGTSCCHSSWTGELENGSVMPAGGGGGGGAARRTTKQPAKTQSGPSKSFRESIDDGSLCCMPGDSDDETADGESIWYVNALGPQEKNTVTFECGPCTLKKGNYSIPIQWLNLLELTDEYAIFEDWPTEQNRESRRRTCSICPTSSGRRWRTGATICRVRSTTHVTNSCECESTEGVEPCVE